jgi:hypothetical protein
MSKPKKRSLSDDMAHEDEPSIEDRQRAREVLRERASNSSLKRKMRALEMELESERHAREFLLNWRDDSPQTHVVRPRKHSRKTRIVSVSCLSDLHIDEEVRADTVNGLNSFNIDEAARRLDYYWNSVAKLVEKEQQASSIRTHVLWIGGDLFSGHIHEDLVESTAFAPLESVLWCRPRIEAGIKFLVDNMDIDELIVVWQYGNHGRDGKKPRVSTAAEHNYEWMLGQVMGDHITQQPWAKKVTWVAERGYHTYLDVGGYVIRFHHGDGIRYAGGVGGLTIPLNKAISKWNEAKHADLDVMGHWHTAHDAHNAVMNGSLIGHNAYAIHIKAGFEPPQQVFFNVDLARKMKTGFFNVHVTPRPGVAK